MNPTKRAKIFDRFEKNNPNPTTELSYNSAYQLIVAVILSAQATDKSVNKATAKLFEVAPSPRNMVDLGEEALSELIRSIGLYKSKAKNIIKTSEKIINDHRENIPNKYDDLIKFPGVGRKTALVILNTFFDHPVIPVDTHVFRVSQRTRIAPGKTVIEVDRKLHRLVPQRYRKNAHHWLVLHGRYVCTARKPQCRKCIIQDLCEHQCKNFS
ncbi:endonuclease III [Candidatus Ichthyocystis hellenicum]|uniref:endonuclease III n=1 Tax=Candidatus Ichthyocystis hellenicum TaxID=1561003 RepID=UPI000B1776DA|nr:endonuclease III [Candidatus Ichthyocystis hellenicum]